MKTRTSTSPANTLQASAPPRAPTAEHHIQVRPTRFGTTFLLILGAMLLGSLNTNNNLGFLLTFLLGSMAAVSVFHTRRNLVGIQLTHIRARPVFAGEPASFDLHLRKSGQTARAVLAALTGENPVTMDLLNGSPVAITISMPSDRRGLLSPGPLGIATQYPFGLFQARTTLAHSAACLVYPRPIAGPLTATAGETVTGGEDGGTGPGVDDFVGLTAYQPGDNLGHISWKAYSRGQGLLTKQFTGAAGRVLTLDWYALGKLDLETRLSRLCGMALHAHKTGLLFGLQLPARTIAPARGESHLKTCLAGLALFGLPGDVAGSRSLDSQPVREAQ